MTMTQGSGTQIARSDQALVARVVAGDEAALSALYDRYSGMLYALLLRILRDAQAAEEVLQDLFFYLWCNAGKFDPERGSLAGWLLVSGRNRAISRLRRFHPAVSLDEPDAPLAATMSSGFNLESAVAQKEMFDKVSRALAGLPALQREAVELAFFEGLTHSEIAVRTQEPLGTIKTRIRSAVQTLRQALRR
jgi:RNA polymerase sigma-70 factor (ECF subfamily)